MNTVVPYMKIRNKIKTCDLIMFRSHNIMSNLISCFEQYVNGNGDFTHMGMCIRAESFYYPNQDSTPTWLQKGKIYLLEATISGFYGHICDVEGRSGLCVQLRDLDTVVDTYEKSRKDYMALYQIQDEHRPAHIEKDSIALQKEYDKYRGLFYDASIVDFCASAFPLLRSVRDNHIYQYMVNMLGSKFFGTRRSKSTDNPELLPKDNYVTNWQFCSKLISNIYVDLGIFPSVVVSGDVMPSDFIVHPTNKHIPSVFASLIYFEPSTHSFLT